MSTGPVCGSRTGTRSIRESVLAKVEISCGGGLNGRSGSIVPERMGLNVRDGLRMSGRVRIAPVFHSRPSKR